MRCVNAVATRRPEDDAPIESLRRDGYVMLPGFFAAERADTARREMETWFEADLRDRQEKRVGGFEHVGAAGRTVLTLPMHNMIDVYGKSATLDAMYETLLTHPVTSSLIRDLAGEHIKARAYNCRWMTGAYDPPPAHDWHRDSPGAFNFGILLTDVPPGGNAATGFVRGSHWYPYNPVWNTLFSERYEGPPAFRKVNVFNRLLRRRMERRFAEASGRQGDAYLFTNDLWHGRQPNLHGRRAMIVLVAFYPSRFPFPCDVKLPAPEVMERLPPAVRAVVRQDKPLDFDERTLIGELAARRRERFDLFYLARLERRFAEGYGRLLPGRRRRSGRT
jgi:Phytanoyl-CoA dioxygenase (PhyH)